MKGFIFYIIIIFNADFINDQKYLHKNNQLRTIIENKTNN